MKPITVALPAKIAVKINPSKKVTAKQIAAKVPVKPTAPTIDDVLLDSAESSMPSHDSITDKLSEIEALLAAEGLPIPRLKAGLKDVMQCLSDNEGSILELEPKDVKLIVRSYTMLADTEVQQIVQGKKKTAKKKAASTLAKIAKDTSVDLNAVDF